MTAANFDGDDEMLQNFEGEFKIAERSKSVEYFSDLCGLRAKPVPTDLENWRSEEVIRQIKIADYSIPNMCNCAYTT